MKKNLLLLLAFVCCITVFTSCEDDKKEASVPAVAGTWKLPEVIIEKNDKGVFVITSSPIHMIWEGNIPADKEGAPILGGIFDLPTVVYMAQGMGAQVLKQVLGEVKLHDNGDISATYSNAGISMMEDKPVIPVWQDSGTGYATYKEVSASQIKVFLNLKKIVGEDPKDVEIMNSIFAMFPVLKKMITDGIPVNCAMSSDKTTCRLFVDKQFVDQFMPLIPVVLEMLPKDDPDLAIVTLILGDLPRVMKETKTFELGLSLKK